jgi:hypothetical protein
MYKLTKPFIPARTVEKVVVCRHLEDLKQYFEPDQILKEHGGLSEYVHPFPATEENPSA